MFWNFVIRTALFINADILYYNFGLQSNKFVYRMLKFSAVATGLEKVSFHSNPKERQCQRMLTLLHNCTYLTR